MSHHFDTAIAREDPRLNILDFYLFRGRAGTTVMAMTVNPNAGTKAPDTLNVMLSLQTNTPIDNGATVTRTKFLDEFPYFGAPHADHIAD